MANRKGTESSLHDGQLISDPELLHRRGQLQNKKPPQIRARYIWMVVLILVVGSYAAVRLKERFRQPIAPKQLKNGPLEALLEITKNPRLTPEEQARADEELQKRMR